ncbi:ras-related and estrogen-regulated growth inhibitor-like protein [Athalia rosae]|uniref:ras-related and estrogen-regulated growth inhibitor-like protein n=1 Tax=Athalia rosae TaxID=37344 RepID=UPI000626C11A|nr:ras-related and estrogen-regulated growth inhibitor-like protein [Athalia rosae]XP_048509929.1 ras-related and estrogen-regulated growth inhibitor-like protein [Athalia rosae]
MKTNDRSGNVSRVRIVVLGSSNVGKSALTVRYLTRRFIGEYRSNTDLLYRQIVTVNNMALNVEIVDVSGEAETSFPADQVAWADGCLIVYSVTDRQSFLYAEECLRHFQEGDSPAVQTVLLANKMDLEHLREVEEVEGRELSKQYGCQFHEISVAEDSSSLYKAFEHLVTECRVLLRNTKTRKFSVSKMIGTLIGTQKSATPSCGGTVVVCNKNDLHYSRVLKRRQNLVAPASL